jgi:flagellin-like hook-associated protein FlgL
MPVIATNTSANTALIYLNKNSRSMDSSLAKLSSGSRIVRVLLMMPLVWPLGLA